MTTMTKYLADRIDVGLCWEWKGSLSGNGYGRAWINGKHVPAHRAVYESLVGPIPKGLVIDHLCMNITCVNPDHLEAVTHGENIKRSPKHKKRIENLRLASQRAYASQTHCLRGHELSEDNVYIPPGSNSRNCRECNKVRPNRRWANS